jgi:hypothetical protein
MEIKRRPMVAFLFAAMLFRRLGGATRYPTIQAMGIALLNPSYRAVKAGGAENKNGDQWSPFCRASG